MFLENMKNRQPEMWRTILMQIDKEDLVTLYIEAIRELHDADYHEEE